MYKNLGIDLGASGVVISAAGVGILDSEWVLGELQGMGDSPPEISGDRDRSVTGKDGEVMLRYPFGEDPLASERTRAAIRLLLDRYGNAEDGGSCVLFSIPCNFGEMEENALTEMAVAAGAREAYLVYSPLAALVGNDLDPGIGAVIVDIGALRTNILAICHGRIFCKRMLSVGGASFDEAIREYVLKKHKVRISPETAEAVKLKVGTVWVGKEKRTIEVRGTDITNGDLCVARISSEEMFSALEEPMAALMEGVCDAITKIPPDYVREVFDTGILLTGGGCLLDGIDKMISGVTGINTACLNDPANATARGLAMLTHFGSETSATGTRNITRYIMKAVKEPQGGIK